MPREDVMKYSSIRVNLKQLVWKLFDTKTRGRHGTVNDVKAKLIDSKGNIKLISCDKIKKGNIILIENGDIIPGAGVVVDGTAWVDESPITGESAPVLKDSNDENKIVIENTKVISNWLKVEITDIF